MFLSIVFPLLRGKCPDKIRQSAFRKSFFAVADIKSLYSDGKSLSARRGFLRCYFFCRLHLVQRIDGLESLPYFS